MQSHAHPPVFLELSLNVYWAKAKLGREEERDAEVAYEVHPCFRGLRVLRKASGSHYGSTVWEIANSRFGIFAFDV